MTAAETVLISSATVVDYLVSVGLVDATDHVEITPLAGGVSNTVLGVRSRAGSWVVKQSLPQLKVADTWLATQERTLTEAAALRLTHELTPQSVPEVVHIDPQAFVLVIGWSKGADWKSLLLHGDADPAVGAALGQLLARWHVYFSHQPQMLQQIDSPEAFDQLRIDPFYRTTAARIPLVADEVNRLISDMADRQVTLVHGDYSPKNVLVDPRSASTPVVLDFEVTHRGDPAFDVAFMVSHLVLKAIHRPTASASLINVAETFLHSYRSGVREVSWRPEPSHLHRHLGALLLSRTDGKSRAEYLDEPQRETARRLGLQILLNDQASDPLIRLKEELA